MFISDFLFPRKCLGCGEKGSYFCSSCLISVRPPKRPVCPHCFKPSILGSTHTRCLKPLSLDGLVSVCQYEGIIRKAIKKLKYRFVTDLAEGLVSLIIQMIREKENRFFPKFDSNWVLVPIPLHPRRKRWRGFNQAEILGKMMAQKMGWQFCHDILTRSKYSQPQAEVKEKEKRRGNIRWAFKINNNSPLDNLKIRNSKFILFDDVWTTGSTIKECGQVLKRRKANKVWALTLTR